MSNLNAMAYSIYDNAYNKGFWAVSDNLPGGRYNVNAILCKLALIHSEVSEALEEVRKTGKINDAVGEEIADVIIRCLDFAHGYGIDINDHIVKKMKKNAERSKLHGKHA